VLQATVGAARLTRQQRREGEKREGSGWLARARTERGAVGSWPPARALCGRGAYARKRVGLSGVRGSGSGRLGIGGAGPRCRRDMR
jgi:hypothetical protein